jgi:hypothetical protein
MTRPQPNHRQSDLFAPKVLPVPIAASDRTKLLPLMSTLLTETLAVVAVTEANDEDHA